MKTYQKICLIFLLCLPLLAHAQLRVRVTEGQVKPIRLALIEVSSQSAQGLAKGLDSLIRYDLNSSGLIDVLQPNSYLENPAYGTPPTLANWQPLGVEAVVQVNVEANQTGQVDVRYMVWNAFNGRRMKEGRLAVARDFWRRIGHRVSDRIYKELTGEDGYFDSKIVYVAETGPRRQRIKRLAIMDTDGENHNILRSRGDSVMTPRYSPVDQKVAYMAFEGRQLKVYVADLTTGQTEPVGAFEGMTFAPRFDATGQKLLLSYAQRGNTDIYEIDLRTKRQTRLTKHPGIDTSASASPDGQSLVFNSDRGGSQQLYVLNRGTGEIKRISFGRGNYATPVWSPRDDLIAFTKIIRGRFSIGVMRPDGSNERILSTSFLDEGPVWSPNGRVLMFYRQAPGEDGRAQLYSVDITGRNLRQIPIPGEGSDPAWSPLLP
ncbi:MAG: Tol-Pal system beta propeller repeat protein TolB [Alphaproteobacteria bacterium]